MDPLFDLSGRVALITGSSQGLGKATARVMAERGAHVIISSRKQVNPPAAYFEKPVDRDALLAKVKELIG